MNSSPISPVPPVLVPARVMPIAPIAPRRDSYDAQPMKAALPQGVGTKLDISA